jgi:hypothetical protein
MVMREKSSKIYDNIVFKHTFTLTNMAVYSVNVYNASTEIWCTIAPPYSLIRVRVR